MVFEADGNQNDAKVAERHVTQMVNILDGSNQAKLPEVGDTKRTKRTIKRGRRKATPDNKSR